MNGMQFRGTEWHPERLGVGEVAGKGQSPSPNSAPDFQCDLGLRFPICQKGLPLFTSWGWLVWGLAAEKGKA